jgi:hypothetical protein
VNNYLIPTFDEWHKTKMGCTFEEKWEYAGALHGTAMRALSVAMRDYVTEMTRLAAARNYMDDSPNAPAQEPAERLGYEPFNYTERS